MARYLVQIIYKSIFPAMLLISEHNSHNRHNIEISHINANHIYTMILNVFCYKSQISCNILNFKELIGNRNSTCYTYIYLVFVWYF